ncbi:MAG TPA: cold shock domain-containing protein [SAR324 cluster bacterium]|nr:cold shock domain-containing protein [Deltaproteobacteria bacterium]HJO46887.1 cold shock domain-containing protein [SAR324 cluster bacterium]
METGTVKFFSPKKGYGFIAISDSDKDIFLHKTVL